MPSHRVLFVDLDGTLVLENTFHVFLRAVARIRGHSAPLALLRYAAHKLPIVRSGPSDVRRVQSKAHLMSWFARLPPEVQQRAVEETVSSANSAVSPPVIAVMDEWRAKGAVVVLATAAPDAYARDIARNVGADEVICSHERDGVWVENVGGQKAAACNQWLKRHQGDGGLIGAVSDHADDVPLFQIADRAYIHAPTHKAASLAALAGLGHSRWWAIDPVSAQPGGGWWFYVRGRTWGPLEDPEARILLSKWRECLAYTGDGWIPANKGFRAISPVMRRDPPMLPSVEERTRMEVRTWLRRRMLRMTH
jgi:phosphoserine phosphatase